MSRQTICYDVIGIVVTSLSVVLLVGGFVLILVFSEDFDKSKDWSSEYSIGIAAIVLGTVTSLLATLYLCLALRRGWKLYGCIDVTAPMKTSSLHLTQLSSKQEMDTRSNDATGATSSIGNDYAVNDVSAKQTTSSRPDGRVTAYDIQQSESKTAETDWDPDTILKDEDMY